MRISIVTPSFNQGRFIERTLQSVHDQQVANLEHVVFDGGSRDETVSILERYSDRLRFQSAPDNGQADAVNKGIRATSGEIIGWLNSDDVYLPGALATVIDYFERHPDVDVLYGNAYHIDRDDAIIEEYPTEDWDLERLKQTCFICQPATFFRRSVVERFGVLDESRHYCLDYEYWLRLALKGAKFARIPEFLAGSRFYEETKTLGSRLKVHREINDMMRSLLGQVPDRWILNYAHVAADEKGLARDDGAFLIHVAAYALFASLRWNRSLNPVLKTVFPWFSRGIRQIASNGRKS